MPRNWETELEEAVDRRFDDMVAIRRRLHQQPEVSGEERATSLFLYQLLGNHGFHVRMGPDGRGVLVDAPGPGAGEPTRGILALRADIDALRIRDEKQVAYRSQVEGVTHACGHDCHTAVVCGAFLALDELQTRGLLPWPIQVRAVFQPSEETATGAREMIRVGAMEGVKAILALHVDPTRALGSVGLRSGRLTATADQIEFRVVGRGGHAARPHEASDPIAAAAQLVSGLYLFIPRVTDSRDAVVVTIGQVTGGHTANVIPEEVSLRGTIRTLSREVRETTMRHIQRLAEGIGRTSDTRIELVAGASTPSVVNDPTLVYLLRQGVARMLGEHAIEDIDRPSMGSEDFAFYLDLAPGAMFRLGCTSPRCGGHALHSPWFDVDEDALRCGAKVLAHAACSWFDPRQR